MTTYTPNYQLPLYEGSDKPDLADQYADAMQLLDAALAAAQAARTELQNSLATLNTNLAATNTNVETALSNAALAKTDAANAVSLSQAATNTANAASAAVAAMQTDVTNNKTLVEEHVNYFADLEITDEASAQDVNTKINNAFQGSMSNTQAITAVNSDLSSLAQRFANEFTFDVHTEQFTPQANVEINVTIAVNKNKSMFKLWGNMKNNGASVSVNKVPIPGLSGWYGVKVNYDTGLRPSEARVISNVGGAVLSGSMQNSAGYVLGTDGCIYLYPGTSASGGWGGPDNLVYWQVPIWLSSADWPTNPDGE